MPAPVGNQNKPAPQPAAERAPAAVPAPVGNQNKPAPQPAAEHAAAHMIAAGALFHACVRTPRLPALSMSRHSILNRPCPGLSTLSQLVPVFSVHVEHFVSHSGLQSRSRCRGTIEFALICLLLSAPNNGNQGQVM